MVTFLGFMAAFCTTAAFIPQSIKVYKSRQTRDISFGMTLLMTIGVLIWLIYGLLISALPLIVANMITLILSLYIFIMKIKLG